ncbi:MAG: indolepyruvate ferredoxin oxidoreductase family protein [Burkholderiales bacterium]|nr:indolepyruvate ferredoxin oxidoreductase family protein [Rhodocyclaceae bacterium]MCA3020766.1 indolepyruvate ferredoxin oxidoreductase family protein [Rhodocyclaceae bacterium]MCA3024560.1 indolepyruvate ferredoxin oxidoreductase family protein [Rhodocyclaceae bacterium]MCA3030438.1 indolepyruvate ferredoxin oxidoreductase family protein [Rhodocyclaceae bacterium]MCA3036952.1 indolepyruvate ferredoxin oxidoreductase family protein [Rhodocyclaceae bacterium]
MSAVPSPAAGLTEAAASSASASVATTTLDDKYLLDHGRVYLTGTQALVRLPMIQRQRDLAAGLNTAGFISGYRGSPLGAYDQALWKAKKFLKEKHVFFTPGVNEELAATAVWGSQQVGLFAGAKYDGVFGIWYGKGPGVDRSGDVFKHANAAGTSKYGGVLLIAGDDHACKSSTLPHQSEHAFDAAMIPVLYPTGVADIIELGLHGFAMSRYSGCYVALKCVSDTVDASASVNLDIDSPRVVLPDDIDLSSGGVHIRWPDVPLEQELRLQHDKIYAALAYARVNKLNRVTIDSREPKLGIIASGKSYLDTMQALEDLGIDARHAAEIGLRVMKVAMPWPLEPTAVREFASGLDEVLVVEEKRQLIEYQLKEQLYNWRDDVRPRVVGKYDEHGEWETHRSPWLLPAAGELTPAMIARVIAKRIAKFYTSTIVEARLKFIEDKEAALARPRSKVTRIPYFCSGCPHNTSTRVPDGSKALAGIGCHYMATWIRPEETMTFTQMGGEGVPWAGIAPFTETKHVFANLGDGTYFHSGLLAIRAAVAAKVNITYKILFNDAVAMTGGQPVDGPLNVPQITQQVYAEGVGRIVVVTDEPEKYPATANFAPGVTVHHRDELEQVQRELREIDGVTILVYDQTCAAEKRRRRKRGTFPDPQKRVVINDLVCEGCGDCGKKSNCLSVIPVETEFGRKRAIDQSSCNKDFSCVKGFCPSFVTVEGGQLRKKKPVVQEVLNALPEPVLPSLDSPWGILVTGVGGTGVVTIGALLGMAAHLENKGVAVLDMTGLAQKGGSVYTHVRIAKSPEDIFAVRIAAGEANALLGCDMIVSTSDEAIAKMQANLTRGVVNAEVSTTGEFTKKPDLHIPVTELEATLRETMAAVEFVDATGITTALMGDAIFTNPFVMGYGYQIGLIPVSAASILRAIELNGAAVEKNKQAFDWGRRAAVDIAAVKKVAFPVEPISGIYKLSESVDEMVARREEFLTGYQNVAYAERYAALVKRVADVEAQKFAGKKALSAAVARYYFKVLAYKDEYEVARLYSDMRFQKKVADQFEGDYKLTFHLAPPVMSVGDPTTGEPRKKVYGPWMMTAFNVLAKFKGLRGTALDLFGYTEERKTERQLIADYEALVDELLRDVTVVNYETAVDLASIPEHIRGFGHVKHAHLVDAKTRWAELLAKFRSGEVTREIRIRAAA